MERTVRIMQQSPLVTRKYMDRKTGDEKVINSVTLKLTDGIDTFLGEITSREKEPLTARSLTFSVSIVYSVQWWFVSGIHSRPVRRCRPRRFTLTKSI